MKINFSKYQGTGNDFVLIDNRDLHFDAKNQPLIAQLCDRKFGIGADGLMLLQNKEGFDFEMVYFNSDGNFSSMCGNGGRCITAYARDLGIIKNKAHFLAVDGPHDVEIKNDLVKLKMIDVPEVEENDTHYYMNTGSPHYVAFNDNVKAMELVNDAKKIRYNERFKAEGTNVNYVEFLSDTEIFARTYERGVEDETLSCGTGVTACAIAAHLHKLEATEIAVKTLGGNLKIYFEDHNKSFKNVWLEGPANFVFKGEIEI